MQEEEDEYEQEEVFQEAKFASRQCARSIGGGGRIGTVNPEWTDSTFDQHLELQEKGRKLR